MHAEDVPSAKQVIKGGSLNLLCIIYGSSLQ